MDDLPKSFRLASIIFLTSPDVDAAWRSILKALWHGMALEKDQGGLAEQSSMWAPNSFERRVVDLQQVHPQLIERAIKTMAVQPASPSQGTSITSPTVTIALPEENAEDRGSAVKLQGELQDLALAMSPTTYLQVQDRPNGS